MAETVKELEAQIVTINDKIAEIELPVIDMVQSYLNGPEVTAVFDQLKTFAEQVSQDTMASGIQGILSSIGIARSQIEHREVVQKSRVDAAKDRAADVKAETKPAAAQPRN